MDSSGQTLVVGAPDDNGGVGAAWAFALSSGTWTQQGHLLGGAGEAGAGKFGASVAVANGGYIALVGAPMSDAGEGQVFTFYYNSSDGWYFFQHMDRAGVSGAAHFGASVALSNNGNAGLVGAPNAASGDGGVYLYSHFGLESPYWIDGAVIQSPATGANFGASAAMSLVGDYDFIGAPLASGGVGAVYEYRHDGTQEAVFSDPSGSTNGHFGASVSLAGGPMDELLVGAPGDSAGAGAAYDFDGANGADWLNDGTAMNPVSAPAVGDAYGTSVAVSADASTALVGAPGTNSADGAATHLSSSITAPGPPVSVHAAAGAESAVVSWGAPDSSGGSPITGYTVTSSPGGLTCHTGTELTCTVLWLTDGQAYTFTVTATNSRGTSAASSASNSVTPEAAVSGGGGTSGGPLANTGTKGDSGSGGPPRPAGSVKVTKRTRTSITFSWGAPQDSTGVIGYRIYEYLSGKWRPVGTTTPNTQWFIRSGLRHKTRHRFEVRAYDAAGNLSSPLIGAWSTTK